MNTKRKQSLIVTVQCEYDTYNHMHCVTGNYATLCALDGDDPTEHQRAIPTPKGAKVDCPACIGLWLITHKYTRRQIDTDVLNEIENS